MAQVKEETKGKTRDLPIKKELRALLVKAADASGVDVVRVTSGGQCKKGTCTKRTGSTRHDEGNAADLQLVVKNRTLKFTDPADLKTFERFVRAATRAGATGVGAGIDYMGPATIHVGFGTRAVWGAKGNAAKAPDWIIKAAKAGWTSALGRSPAAALKSEAVLEEGAFGSLDSDEEETEDDWE